MTKNVEKAHQGILEASGGGSDLVLLPELWSTGYDLENSAAHARINAEIESDIAAWCKSLNLSVGGSMLKNSPYGIQNTFQLHSPSGERIAQYPKIHLFSLMNEESLPDSRGYIGACEHALG